MKTNYVIILFLFLSCEKGELPVPVHETGDELTNSVDIGADYKNQLFFNLEQNVVITSNVKTEWDIAFEASDTGWHVRLNTAKGMAVSESNSLFENTLDTSGAQWKWDAHSGHQDSTAIDNWQHFNGTYIIDRGYDHLGAHQGFSKIKLISFSDSDYEILFGDLTSVVGQTATISKNDLVGYSYFNLTSGTTISIAPAKTEWDLLFTQYTHVFDGPTPYLVTGVLINPHQTEVAIIDDLTFSEIAFEDLSSLTFSSNLNGIGYDWKYYDFGASLYLVDASKIFIIKTQQGYYYKFHFIDFYSESGVKGHPKFEFQRL